MPSPQPNAPAIGKPTTKPEKLLAQRFTAGAESLYLRLMHHTGWLKPYRVTISYTDGKARKTGVLANDMTEPGGRADFKDQCEKAIADGWQEALGRGEGSLTAIPKPKRAAK